MIRAVLLDALGTLLELEDPGPPLAAELERRGAPTSVEQARAAMQAEMTYYRAHHDEGSDRERLADLRSRCVGVLAAALPPAARRLAPQELGDALMAALRFRPFPDVEASLLELRADGVRTIVVSNWDVSLHDQLAATGLAALVDAAVSSAEVGAGKPERAIFARALRLAGVGAGEALMVGDSADTDVLGAERAGIAAVLIDRAGTSPGPSARAPHRPPSRQDLQPIGSLSELPPLVQSLA